MVLLAKKQIEAVFDSIADGIVVIDNQYNITRVNKAYTNFVSQDLSSLLLSKCHNVLRQLDHPCPECPLTNTRYIEGYNLQLSGKQLQIEVHPHLSEGQVVNFIETVRDITRFEELQAQLRRKERLASIGIMVAGIAHEMNNPLSGISGNSQLMLQFPENYGLNPKGTSRIQTIYDSAAKASHILEDLLNFSGNSSMSFEPIDLAYFIQTWIDSLPLTSLALIRSHFGPPLRIWTHKELLTKALGKILDNALQSLEERKKRIGLFEPSIYITGNDLNSSISLLFEDNGTGIDPKNMENIFEPFFTTREPGKGVGLGLSICHRIMAQHYGTITLTNLNPGIRVELKFPKEKPL